MIEVYPFAARVKLKMKNSLHHDELDGILSAYTAYCKGIKRVEKISGSDGEIYIPLPQS